MRPRWMARVGILAAIACAGSGSIVCGQDLDTTTFDTSVRVQDDLFLYVNGSWLRNTEIPADKSNYGSFIALDDLSRERIRNIVDEIAKSEHEKGTVSQKVADAYRSFLNEEILNEKGVSPIRSQLQEIYNLKTHEDVVKKFGELSLIGVGSPIGVFVSIDRKDSTRYLTNMIQWGTTLPDRDYYLQDDEKYVAARAALVEYINQLFQLAGLESDNPGERILALETRLADAQWPRTEMRQAEKTYNTFAFADLKNLSSKVDWKAMFDAAKFPEVEEVCVMTPSFFEKFDSILEETSVEDWQAYLQYQILDSFAPFLSKEFDVAHFKLHSEQLAGTKEQEPRWKRAVGFLGGALGEAVGEVYVNEHFKPEAKERMNELVQNLLKAFEMSVDELTWMTDETKVRAKEKLSKINTKIGYPDEWRDYSKLEIDADDLVGNVMRSAEFEHFRNVNRLGKPIDKKEWGMTPQTVNAYYNPTMNEIVFPAAILQSPFFSMNAPDALNYGGIGAVIGHEISHAFDDQGSKYDGDGNLNNWWTDADRKAFEELTTQLVDQYAGYTPMEGKNVNGNLTLGENIADLSGLSIAYKAYKISQEGKEPEKFLDWDGDQLFFIGWSRVWQRKYRDEELVRRLATDPHSPSHFRANGPVTNIDAFYTAFGVKEGDSLFKPEADRIRIW
ncbi:MAG: M13 family metallopeptidase [Pirellulaceae bacterium]